MQTRLVIVIALAGGLVSSTASTAHGQTPPDDPTDPNTPPPTAPADPTPVVIVNPPPPTPPAIVEPQYETVTDPWNAPLFTSGALVFLGSYGASVIVAATSEDDTIDRGNDRLYVPVVGPWLALDDRPDCPVQTESCDMETTKKVLLVADGILQAGGVVTMIAALLSPTERRVVRHPTVTMTKNVTVSPTAGGNPGISLLGRW